MRAMVLQAPRSLEEVRTDPPNREDDEVMIKVTHGGICGTDLKIFEGQIATQYPLVMGHEMVGSVIEHPNRSNLNDARVIVDPVLFCGKCYLCKNDLTNLCRAGGLLGRDKQGGFGEYVTVPSDNVYLLPDTVADHEAPLIQVLTTCMHAQRRAGVSKDEAVVVMGLGVTGLLHMQLAKAYGANPVICVTKSPWKRDLAEALGADAVYEAGDDARLGVEKLTGGRGADLVIECSGQLSVLAGAFDLVRFGGRVMPFGIHTENKGDFPFYQLYFKEINIINARAARSVDFPEAINLVRRAMVRLEPLVTHVEPLSELPNAIKMLKDNSVKRMKVIIDNSC